MLKWVCFDVGETLFDERGLWSRWAQWLNATPETFIQELKTIIQRDDPYQKVFSVFRPDFDIAVEKARRQAAG
ncbi:MAG: hypothetical protein ACK5JT_16400 [Hyphomicrobiaceae bacterium]